MTSRGRLLIQKALQDCTISTGDYVVNHDGSLSFINNAVNHNEEAANLNEDKTNFVENPFNIDEDAIIILSEDALDPVEEAVNHYEDTTTPNEDSTTPNEDSMNYEEGALNHDIESKPNEDEMNPEIEQELIGLREHDSHAKEEPRKTTRKKRHQVSPKTWKINEWKTARKHGKAYKRKKEIRGRKMEI